MSSTTKLLPCPFCSNADISIKNENPKDNSGGYFIECPGCGASTALRFACGDDPTHLLAEQWNLRTASNRLHQIQEPEADIWPCVNIDVDESGKITNAKLYSPGLPAGNHDVYPVRVPYMDEHTEAWLACAAELRKHLPDFMHLRDMNGIECAVAAIRELAERSAPAQAAPAAVAVADGWKLVPIQVPSSAFLWVSGGYSADYKASDPRDQKVIDERAQSTWENILDSISPPALAATPAAPAADTPTAFPAMTEELASILGLMCFQCIRFAQALRAGGYSIEKRAEDEQAAVLHWMLGHYFRSGPDGWRAAASADMERLAAQRATLAAQEKE